MVTLFAGLAATNDDAEVELTKRLTHDNLIAQLGDRRRSGVRWRLLDADDPRAFAFLDGLDRLHSHREHHEPVGASTPDVEVLPETDYSGLRREMRAHPEGVLVVAECDSVL